MSNHLYSFAAESKTLSLKISRLYAHLALFTVALIYGLNYSIAKDVMPNYIQPLGFILVRAIGATTLFWLSSLAFKWEKIERKDFPRLILSGFFGVACNQMLFFQGLNMTSPISAAIMMTINPVMVLVMSALILKEALEPVRFVGIGLGIIGAILLITRGTADFSFLSSDESLGNLFVLLNAASYAAYLVTVKPLMVKYKPITVIKWTFLFGFFMIIPFGLEQFQAVDWSLMPSSIIGAVVFVVLGTTYMAYLLNIFALKTVSPTTVSFYIYLQPLIAAIVAIALGKDHLTVILWVAAALIFSGVYLVSFYKR